jgi:hypothetical protein
MVTLLITSVSILSLLGIALYLWQRPRKPPDYEELPPKPDKLRGLFDPVPEQQLISDQSDAKLSEWLERADRGDHEVLKEAVNQSSSYKTLLDSFISKTKKPSEVLSLCSYLTRNELPLNSQVANAFIDTQLDSIDRNSVSKILHIAALSDDAAVFRRAVELSLSTWRDGRLSNVSSTELQALLNGEYWVLSSSTRSSGAGFVLKQTLAAARRELEESINNQPSTASS